MREIHQSKHNDGAILLVVPPGCVLASTLYSCVTTLASTLSCHICIASSLVSNPAYDDVRTPMTSGLTICLDSFRLAM